jgi:hypothetical protein
MHLCNRWADCRNQDFSRLRLHKIGSVKLSEDADSIGYDPDKHLHVTDRGGGAHLEYAAAVSFFGVLLKADETVPLPRS